MQIRKQFILRALLMALSANATLVMADAAAGIKRILKLLSHYTIERLVMEARGVMNSIWHKLHMQKNYRCVSLNLHPLDNRPKRSIFKPKQTNGMQN